jgi:hypothetical protein
MSLSRPGRDGVPVTCLGMVLNPRWVQDLNRNNIPCLRSMPDVTLTNSRPHTAIFQDHYGSHYKKKKTAARVNDAIKI